MEEEVFLTKKEKRQLAKERKREERSVESSKGVKKKIITYSIISLIVVVIMFFILRGGEVIIPSIDDDPFIGDINAPLTLIEFGDFQCPFTRQFNSEVLPSLLEEYEGKIKIVYRDMITNKHINSDISAEAAQCADEQGKFKEYHDIVFSRQGAASKIDLVSYARQIELDMSKFNSCFDSRKYKDEVRKDTKDGRLSNVQVTPTIFINNIKMNGIFDLNEYKRIIDQELLKMG